MPQQRRSIGVYRGMEQNSDRAGGITRQPEETEGPERRAHIRVDAPGLTVEIPWTSVQDISEGGMRLITKSRMVTGQDYSLSLTEQDPRRTVELKGRVVWQRDLSDDLFLVGLQWVEVGPAARAWLAAKVAAWAAASGS